MLRTALTLAALTGRAVEVSNIRAGRKVPGLRPQHLLSALAASKVTSGRVEGARTGSRTMRFIPGPSVRPGDYAFDVAEETGSAGSTALVFQTIALPLAFAPGPSSVAIKGGTHVAWSPPADYLREVYLPAIAPMGLSFSVEVPLWGFYPIGGGELDVRIDPADPPIRPLSLVERGTLKRASVLSVVSNLPLSIAQRQLAAARKGLRGLLVDAAGECREVPGPGRGTFLFITIEFENIKAGFSALGERGKPAEEVGAEAARLACAYLDSTGAADPHLADQLALPMALARGMSTLTTTEITGHLLTNIDIIKAFLDVEFAVTGRAGGPGAVQVDGAGFVPHGQGKMI